MIWLLSLLFIALQVLDWALTMEILRRGGRELNPVMRWILGRGGRWGMLAVKLVLAGVMIWACLAMHLSWLIAVLSLGFVAVCAWNAWVLARMPREEG